MKKDNARFIAGLVAVFLQLPIYFYLFYKILEAVNASELMWFLYWVYVPVTLFIHIMVRFYYDGAK